MIYALLSVFAGGALLALIGYIVASIEAKEEASRAVEILPPWEYPLCPEHLEHIRQTNPQEYARIMRAHIRVRVKDLHLN